MKFKDRLDDAYGKKRKGDESGAADPGSPAKGSASPAAAGQESGRNASSPRKEPPKAEDGSKTLLKTGSDGLSKAARFLVLLGKEEAAKVIACLRPEEIEALSSEIAKLRAIDPIEAKETLAEFGWLVKTGGQSFEGGPETAEKMLVAAFGAEKARELMKRAAPEAVRPFAFLDSFSAEQIAVVLDDEPTQVLSVVLPFLDPRKASAVLSGLPEDRRNDTVRRIARLEKVAPDALKGVEEGIRRKLARIARVEEETIDGRTALADILRNVDPSLSESILERLAVDAPSISRDVRERLFTADDVLRVPSRELQAILMGFDEKTLALALKGRDASFGDALLSNVSRARRATVLEERELLGSVRRNDAKEALAMLVAECKRRYEAGDFALEGDDDLVD